MDQSIEKHPIYKKIMVSRDDLVDNDNLRCIFFPNGIMTAMN